MEPETTKCISCGKTIGVAFTIFGPLCDFCHDHVMTETNDGECAICGSENDLDHYTVEGLPDTMLICDDCADHVDADVVTRVVSDNERSFGPHGRRRDWR